MTALSDYVDIDERLLALTAGRVELTKFDPLLFALVYMPHHLRGEETGDQITLNDFHIALVEYAKEWIKPLDGQAKYRDAFIAPRNCGKSTWLFTILPLWAAAHGHVKFIAAFADAAKQAEQHLWTFKNELDNNELLRLDYPELCTPKKRAGRAVQIADNRGQIHQANGFIFMARGADGATLGMKVGEMRPRLIILDDIEPGEANYSAYQKEQRLKTLQDVIFPLNSFARVVISGTTTMSGSIIHDLVRSTELNEDSEEAKELAWVKEEKIKVHYFPAIIQNDDGSERSIWPEKWPLEDLVEIRHTRQFLKNMMNKPMNLDGQFWNHEDFRFGKPNNYGNTLISLDPAVTNNKVSDFSGLSVISRGGDEPNNIYVRFAAQYKQSPKELRETVMNVLRQFPETGLLLIETNQGGDLWNELFHDLPVKVRTVHQKESKAFRAQAALTFYQKKQVFHTQKFTVLEEQMMGFPAVAHDDVLDSVSTGILYFLNTNNKPAGTRVKQGSYI